MTASLRNNAAAPEARPETCFRSLVLPSWLPRHESLLSATLLHEITSEASRACSSPEVGAPNLLSTCTELLVRSLGIRASGPRSCMRVPSIGPAVRRFCGGEVVRLLPTDGAELYQSEVYPAEGYYYILYVPFTI